MPLVLQGFDRTILYLDEFEIELSQEMNRKIDHAMKPIQSKAKGFIKGTLPKGLIGWSKPPTAESYYRPFPIFNAAEMRAGIKYHPGLQSQTKRGFIQAYSVTNESAAGAIYETAGRKHPHGIPGKSRSGVRGSDGKFYPNPGAGEHFIDALPLISRASRAKGSRGRSQKNANGRAIFKAWNQDQSKVVGAVAAAINTAVSGFNAKHTNVKVAI
jgi:hypothetical protein